MVFSSRGPTTGPQSADIGTDQAFEYWYGQGEFLANQGRYGEALRQFEESLALRPRSAAAGIYRATCLIHLQRYSEALDCCDRILGHQPDHCQAWLFRGVALQKLGQYRQAYRSYDRAGGKHVPQPSLWRRLTRFVLGE